MIIGLVGARRSTNGHAALELVKEVRPWVPFIFTSGTPGAEAAVQALESGATDYVPKDRMERLVPAIRRAMRGVEERGARDEEAPRRRRVPGHVRVC